MDTTPQLAFRQIRTRRVFEEICEQIRSRLASGSLKPGDKLPAERDLALEFKVSRPAVREALRTLEISGVVSLRKGVKGGAFIHDGNPALLTQSLQDQMSLGSVSIESLAETRVLINDVVMKLACERATETDFEAIERNIAHIASSDDLRHRADEGVLFFHLVATATRNEVLTMLVDSLGHIVRVVIDRTGRKAHPELTAVRLRILAAMRARDPATARIAMNEYLSAVHDSIYAPASAVLKPAEAVAEAAPAVRPKAAGRGRRNPAPAT